jgi:CxxC motif-containing protein (DUF1111 family)
MKTILIFIGGSACAPAPIQVGPDRVGTPIPGLDVVWQARFDEGDRLFEVPFSPASGVGPVYIRSSCAGCHADDLRGPGIVEKMALVADDRVTPTHTELDFPWGVTVRAQLAAGARTPVVPPDRTDLLLTRRLPPDVLGVGLAEAVPDADILAEASRQHREVPELAGRISWVAWRGGANPDTGFHSYGPGATDLIGRFGLKAAWPTLDAFTAGALHGDMGVTTPVFPDEAPNPDGILDDGKPGVDLDLDGVNVIADYMRLLALPERAQPDDPGAALFADIGCTECHTPSFTTRSDHPVPQMANVQALLYSDFLLHDLGPDHADAQVEGEAGSTWWRTAPLVGLRFHRAFLHDGRSPTVEDAILDHGGPGSQARSSIEDFDRLSARDRAILLAFLESL